MARIIVTGGAGFIGSHLADRLIEEGHEVSVVDNLSTGKREFVNPKAAFFKEDIKDLGKMKEIFEKVKPEFVFHEAAIPRMPLSVEDPAGTSEINIQGTVNVFKASVDAGVKRVIYASSSSAYGDQETLPLKESMVPNPMSPYGLQKLVGEYFARLFGELYNLPIVSLRYFNVYGPRVDFDSDYGLVIGKFLRLYKEGKPLTIFGDGKQTRAFNYVDDVVEANLKAMTSEKIKGGEVINIGGERPISVLEIAEAIGGEKEFLPPRPGDPKHTDADISKAKELLGWEPRVGFEEGVEKVRNWFESL